MSKRGRSCAWYLVKCCFEIDRFSRDGLHSPMYLMFSCTCRCMAFRCIRSRNKLPDWRAVSWNRQGLSWKEQLLGYSTLQNVGRLLQRRELRNIVQKSSEKFIFGFAGINQRDRAILATHSTPHSMWSVLSPTRMVALSPENSALLSCSHYANYFSTTEGF